MVCWSGTLRAKRRELDSCYQNRGEESGFVSGAGMLLHTETCPSAILLLLGFRHSLLLSQTHTWAHDKSGMTVTVRAFVLMSYFPLGLPLPFTRQEFKEGGTVLAWGLHIPCQGSGSCHHSVTRMASIIPVCPNETGCLDLVLPLLCSPTIPSFCLQPSWHLSHLQQ